MRSTRSIATARSQQHCTIGQTFVVTFGTTPPLAVLVVSALHCTWIRTVTEAMAASPSGAPMRMGMTPARSSAAWQAAEFSAVSLAVLDAMSAVDPPAAGEVPSNSWTVCRAQSRLHAV